MTPMTDQEWLEAARKRLMGSEAEILATVPAWYSDSPEGRAYWVGQYRRSLEHKMRIIESRAWRLRTFGPTDGRRSRPPESDPAT